MDNYVILDGKSLSKQIENKLESEVSALKKQNIFPLLCVILVGDNPSSISYVNMKIRSCNKIGIRSKLVKFSIDITQDQLLNEIHRLNNDNDVCAILVQLPLPSHINKEIILESIDINKDVDGFHPYNLGRLYANIDGGFIPATPMGIITLLKHYEIDFEGKNVVIVGTSNIVGKPLAAMMINLGATVCMCNIFTRNLKDYTLRADILCVGVGKSKLITKDMVKEDSIIVDIGINKKENNAIEGDVDFENIKSIASFITPVPGGVGPMTISSLLVNTLKAAKLNTLKAME